MSEGGLADRRAAGQGKAPELPVRPSAGPPAQLTCQRCNFPVPDRAPGCRNPCPNCRTVYPLGDCSD